MIPSESDCNEDLCDEIELLKLHITDLEAQLATAKEKAAALDRLEELLDRSFKFIPTLQGYEIRDRMGDIVGMGKDLTEAIMNAGEGE